MPRGQRAFVCPSDSYYTYNPYIISSEKFSRQILIDVALLSFTYLGLIQILTSSAHRHVRFCFVLNTDLRQSRQTPETIGVGTATVSKCDLISNPFTAVPTFQPHFSLVARPIQWLRLFPALVGWCSGSLQGPQLAVTIHSAFRPVASHGATAEEIVSSLLFQMAFHRSIGGIT